ncbi:MAG: HAMP domain-containing protein [Myxococcales bacterium]|nr:HAMP domain-containing protein [Myxococcales bacterium]
MKLRRAFSRIQVRLLAFNALLVFLPAAGVLFLDTYEEQLLRDQERAMVHQGRLLAAALSGRAPLREADARRTLVALEQEADARIRVLDANGGVLVDSSRLGRAQEPDGVVVPALAARESWLYRIGAIPFRLWRDLLEPPEPPHETADAYAGGGPLDGREIRVALSGRYGAATRISSGGQRSVTLYSALPIRRGSDVTGVVLVSQSTYRILQKLYRVRMDVLRVFLASLAAAIVLSLVVSTTIARPLVRLRNQADSLLDARGRLRGPLHASDRSDEIGDLGRALEALTRRLDAHIGWVEGFASDVSHELRNPLGSIRAASEMLAEVESTAERKRFLEMIQREIARMEVLLAGVREVSRLDAGAWPEQPEPVELGALLSGLAESFATRGETRVVVSRPEEPLVVRAPADGLARAVENVIDNAAGFSPPDGRVEVVLTRESDRARIQVLDRGPGIPAEHRERVFDRFFSYRPGTAPGDRHTGLGLAIVRAQVENAGGRVEAREREGGGTGIEIRLPLADADGEVRPERRA